MRSDYITYSQEYRAKGIEYYQQGDYTDAASAFRNAVHQQPPDYTSHYYLGACLAQRAITSRPSSNIRRVCR